MFCFDEAVNFVSTIVVLNFWEIYKNTHIHIHTHTHTYTHTHTHTHTHTRLTCVTRTNTAIRVNTEELEHIKEVDIQ